MDPKTSKGVLFALFTIVFALNYITLESNKLNLVMTWIMYFLIPIPSQLFLTHMKIIAHILQRMQKWTNLSRYFTFKTWLRAKSRCISLRSKSSDITFLRKLIHTSGTWNKDIRYLTKTQLTTNDEDYYTNYIPWEEVICHFKATSKWQVHVDSTSL